MKIGLMAFSSPTGLGYQTREFYKYIQPAKTLIVDISKLNHMPVDHSWCKDPRITDGRPTDQDLDWLLDDMDVVFLCETPLDWEFFDYARKKGVKTVLQYNYEFLEYFRNPILPKPDVLAAPSLWNIQRVIDSNFARVMSWQVPIDSEKFKPRKISKVKTIGHIIGRPAMYDRNGTIDFVKTITKHLDEEYNYKIFLQQPKEQIAMEHFRKAKEALDFAQGILGSRLEVIKDIENNEDMYKNIDLLVLPRRYGGLCLPMLEALGNGIPVLMPDIDPNYTMLPKKWLFEAEYKESFHTSSKIDVHESNPYDIARVIKDVSEDIEQENEVAIAIANTLSWEKRKEYYTEAFKLACEL